MSDAVLIALIAMVGSILTTAITGIALVKVNQVLAAAKRTEATAAATQSAVNGVTHELIEAKVIGAEAKGFSAGEQAQRDRAAEAQP